MSKVNRSLFWLCLLPAVLLCGIASTSARADTPAVIDCPWYSPTTATDIFGVQGFYIPSYPGTSLQTVTLYLSPSTMGSYSLTLKAALGSFTGALVGTAAVSLTFSSTAPVPVVFGFGNLGVAQGSAVTFQGRATGPGAVLMQVATSGACLAIETNGTAAPLSTFRRQGPAVTITGNLPATFSHAVTVPAVASIHGVNGTFFHTDAWLYNFDVNALNVAATYYCYLADSCPSAVQSFSIGPGMGLRYSDIVSTLFSAPETAGALVFNYSSTSSANTLRVLTRTYTPSPPSPTNGASLPGELLTSASGQSLFVGLGNNGGDRSAGFRTNVGVFNAYGYPATVTFRLTTTDGQLLGSVTQSWAPREARQINDIFATVGAQSVVTSDAILTVNSDIPVYSYVTVIDNQSGDSVIQ